MPESARPEPAKPDGRELFWPSLVFLLGACMAAVAFRNLGWDTRALTGRLPSAVGHVLTSDADGNFCRKGGGCVPMYKTTIAYGGGRGEQVFSTRWGARYQPGQAVNLEHAIGRPGMARIVLTSDFSSNIWSFLAGACGLGCPLVIIGLFMLVGALTSGARPDRRVRLVWLAGAAAVLPLVWFIYWY